MDLVLAEVPHRVLRPGLVRVRRESLGILADVSAEADGQYHAQQLQAGDGRARSDQHRALAPEPQHQLQEAALQAGETVIRQGIKGCTKSGLPPC